MPSVPDEKTARVFAMDTVAVLTVYGKEAEAAIADFERELLRLERLLSAFDENSGVHEINSAQGKAVRSEPELLKIIAMSKEISLMTGGAFDITIAPIVRAWGFGGENRVPGEGEIAGLLPLIGHEKVRVDGDEITLEKGAMIDLGAIAKGYAAGVLAQLAAEHDIKGAVISLGGNVQTFGEKPGGKPWRVAIQDPLDKSAYAAVVEIAAGVSTAVVTSGAYQRYFEEGGEVYHHIIDPQTGYPSRSGLLSATVICSDSAVADALSTAFFVLGAEKSLEAAENISESAGWEIDFILITDEGKLLYTPGLEGMISHENKAYSMEMIGG
jgi:thiamine biosynthesis lipoprotein